MVRSPFASNTNRTGPDTLTDNVFPVDGEVVKVTFSAPVMRKFPLLKVITFSRSTSKWAKTVNGHMPAIVWSGLLTGSVVGRSAEAIGATNTTERTAANRQHKRRINTLPSLLCLPPQGGAAVHEPVDYATLATN